ncbi:hypothetical protein Pta02_41960 [Planobispora takensis]|uniref:Fibronectin type-III domain-containing protein n=1 Tax=Planobispora takensis TaxID=1367882 RepID=A0A8J3SXV8_9ACTN|nr:hypothetical protein Pta02_41960 [Planobispora takensis]
MTTARRLVAVMVTVPIVSVSAVLATAGPAQAQARLDMPSRVTSNQGVTISGKVDFAFDAVLYVDGQQVAKGDQRVSYTWNPRSRPNGSYRIKLVQRGKLLGGRWDETSETLVQAVPPATPGGVGVRLQGKQAVVTWRKGSEPDLRGYEIATTRNGRVGSVRVNSACGGGSCRATLAVPAKAAGQRIGFTVRALRSDGGGGTVASGQSAAAMVSIPAPKAPKVTDSDGNGTRQSTGDQDARKKADRQAGIENLPQLPQKKPATARAEPPKTAVVPTKVPKLPEEVREDDAPSSAEQSGEGTTKKGAGNGTEKGTQPAPDSKRVATETDVVPAANTNITPQSSESSTGGMSQYGLFIAGGLILLLLAAHGGAWFRRKLLAAGAADAATTGIVMTAAAGAGSDREARTEGAAGASTAGAATTTPRRPAVILAVSKTRYPQPPPASPPTEQKAIPAHTTHLEEQPIPGTRTVRSAEQDVPEVRGVQPVAQPVPEVHGVRLVGQFVPGARAAHPVQQSAPEVPAVLPQEQAVPEVQAVRPVEQAASEVNGTHLTAQAAPEMQAVRPGEQAVPEVNGAHLTAQAVSEVQAVRPVERTVPEVGPVQATAQAVPEVHDARPMRQFEAGAHGAHGQRQPASGPQATSPADAQTRFLEDVQVPSTAQQVPSPTQGKVVTAHTVDQQETGLQVGNQREAGAWAGSAAYVVDQSDSGVQAGIRVGSAVHVMGQPRSAVRAEERSGNGGHAAGRSVPVIHAVHTVGRTDGQGIHATSGRASAQPDSQTDGVPGEYAESVPTIRPDAESIAGVNMVTPVAARMGERWDDYLPPAPRSMEDSGFWERPQPGATDFWAADDDDSTYSGRRRRPDGT